MVVSYTTLSGWAKKYKSDGLTFLDDQPCPGRPVGLSVEDRAKITAIVCSTPPDGYVRWSLRLLADEVAAAARLSWV
ncbi:MAG: helix-turn-helix domain-containing protein [Bacteroidota bacterium]